MQLSELLIRRNGVVGIRRGLARATAVLLLALCAVSVSAQTTIYVATNGNDTTGDGSAGNPYLTISNGVAKAVGGDTVLVSNGVYAVTAHISVYTNITVRGLNGYTNTIVDGGGTTRLFVLNHSNAVLEGLTLTNGRFTAVSGAGGIYIIQGTMRNCAVVNCVNTTNGPGGLRLFSGRVEQCLIRGNSSYGVDNICAGVFMGGGTVSNCSIISNVTTSASSAGGVSIIPTGQVENCTINGNSGGKGGILIVADGTVKDCTVINNVSTNGNTGGIHFDDGATASGEALVENCVISSNICTAVNSVGGIHFGADARINGAIVRNCLISYNIASNGYVGGVVWAFQQANSQKCRLENCTVIYNNGGYLGGALLYRGGQIINSLIYYNNSGSLGTNICFASGSDGTGRVDYSCSYPIAELGALGQNNITNAPLMVDTNAGNFRLTVNSPCINTGTNQSWMNSAKDLDGRHRVDVYSGIVDMGCYEYLPSGTLFSIK